jgi:hypothetical protein
MSEQVKKSICECCEEKEATRFCPSTDSVECDCGVCDDCYDVEYICESHKIYCDGCEGQIHIFGQRTYFLPCGANFCKRCVEEHDCEKCDEPVVVIKGLSPSSCVICRRVIRRRNRSSV